MGLSRSPFSASNGHPSLPHNPMPTGHSDLRQVLQCPYSILDPILYKRANWQRLPKICAGGDGKFRAGRVVPAQKNLLYGV